SAPARKRIRGKARAVLARAGKRGEKITGAHLAAVQVDAGDRWSAAWKKRSGPPQPRKETTEAQGRATPTVQRDQRVARRAPSQGSWNPSFVCAARAVRAVDVFCGFAPFARAS